MHECTNAPMHQCTNAPMQQRRRVVLCALVHWCIGAFSVVPSSAETIDRVLAIVAGQVITLSDVAATRELGLHGVNVGGYPTAAGPVDSVDPVDPVRTVLNTLIDRALVLAEVERYAPAEPTAQAIDTEVARVRARFATAEAFDSALARAGINDSDLRQLLRRDLRIAAYLDQRFTAAHTRRQTLIGDWLAGLRNRGEIVDLYLTRN